MSKAPTNAMLSAHHGQLGGHHCWLHSPCPPSLTVQSPVSGNPSHNICKGDETHPRDAHDLEGLFWSSHHS
ncbi:hypothetical protein LEMLEM_LOCUS5221 [Lemmus lemmus]